MTPTPDFGTLGPVGILAAFMWYLLRTLLPKMIADLQTENTTMRTAFTAALEAQQKTFTDQMGAFRTEFTGELRRLSDTINRQNMVLVALSGRPEIRTLLEDFEAAQNCPVMKSKVANVEQAGAAYHPPTTTGA